MATAMAMREGKFCWYELMTTDVDAAQAFYADVVGWTIADSGMSGIHYLLAKVGETSVAGMMTFPPDCEHAPPAWIGHIAVDDVDATTDRVVATGGTVQRAPADIPGIGRFSVVADPQGATVMLFHATGFAPSALASDAAGNVGWVELRTSDWERAFAFYQGLFDWEKAYGHDMGPMGVYQTFNVDGAWTGGMMNFNEGPPHWAFYFSVDDIDAAAARVTARGGRVVAGPHEVPGGSWIVTAIDPQGAHFALTGRRTS